MTTTTTDTRPRTSPVTPTPNAVEWHLGSLMIWHVSATDSGGLLSLGEVVVRPGAEPPLHVHAREDETWFVLEGTVLFQRGHERILASAGDALLLPRGIPHGFAVRSDRARMLHVYTPGGIEAAFHEVSIPAPARELPPAQPAPPDAATRARIEAAYAARGVTFVGPPLPVILTGESRG